MSKLPVEILSEVFQLLLEIGERCSISNCTLVCKAWSGPSQRVLFSDIYIDDKIALDKFVESIKKNEQLGTLVKCIDLNVSVPYSNPYQNTTFMDIFSLVPNLKTFLSAYRINFLPILDALYDLKLTRLKYIAVETLPEEDFDNYTNCAMFMKKRLKFLMLADRRVADRRVADRRVADRRVADRRVADRGVTDRRLADRRVADRRMFDINSSEESDYLTRKEADVNSKEKMNFDRAFNNLHQFSKLEEIYLTTYAKDPIGILESISEKCPQLDTLSFDLGYDYNSPVKTTGYAVVPRPNIKFLNGIELQFNNNDLLLYIMHAYPQLQHLFLCTKYNNVSKALHKQIVIQLFDYLSKIKYVTLIGLCLHIEDHVDTFRKFWKDSSNPTLTSIEIKYGDESLDMVKLNIWKNIKSFGNNGGKAKIRYYRQRGDVVAHNEIFEEFGEMFKTISFTRSHLYLISDTTPLARDDFFGKFIDHALRHCPNLQVLQISNYQLKKIDFSKPDPPGQRMQLSYLDIVNSGVHNTVFRELSTAINNLGHLRLLKNYYLKEGKLDYCPKIDMLNTVIHTITIDFSDIPSTLVYFKIYTSKWKECRRYRYDAKSSTNEVFELAHETERENGDYCVLVRCYSLKKLKVILDQKSVFISFSS